MRLRLAALGLCGGLMACAAPVLPPLDLTGAQCVSAPDLAAASKSDGDGKQSFKFDFDEHTACLQQDGGKSLYATLQLPQKSSIVRVSSLTVPSNQVAALRLDVLDAAGKPIRSVPGESFMFRGNQWTGQLRTHAGDAYLLVLTDPQQVGRNLSRITEGTRVQVLPAGPVMVAYASGADASSQINFGHRGKIEVDFAPLP